MILSKPRRDEALIEIRGGKGYATPQFQRFLEDLAGSDDVFARVVAILVAGSGVTITVDSVNKTIEIKAP